MAKKMKVWSLYLDDGESTWREFVPAYSRKDACAYVAGNGEVVAVKEASDKGVDIYALAETLANGGWKQDAIDIVVRAIVRTGLDRETV